MRKIFGDVSLCVRKSHWSLLPSQGQPASATKWNLAANAVVNPDVRKNSRPEMRPLAPQHADRVRYLILHPPSGWRVKSLTIREKGVPIR